MPLSPASSSRWRCDLTDNFSLLSFVFRSLPSIDSTSAAFPEYKAWIEIEEEPAKVHGVENKRAHGIGDTKSNEELHCAIEGKAGTRFAVCMMDNRRGADSNLSAEVYLEGQ